MERYICIHGHFYQPPRENPWLEAVEVQDSAYPFHDWNERINAECYAPNTASRINAEGRILNIVNNYSNISFNFGPTLLSWMELQAKDTYDAIIEADRVSRDRFSGHGSAIAQAYNHMIMPLANSRDKYTQVVWGITDFRHRFGREPEGMWLPETAVDLETLDIMAGKGIKFTILAPRQACRVRPLDAPDAWEDVTEGKVDPTMAYLCQLPSGRSINIFFYDGPISQGIAFENILASGESFASRLVGAFNDARERPQIVHIATDGETYGHHHHFGDMALAYCLHYIESNNLAKITNYGEYLEHHPPNRVVEIFENSSWSCIHGVERWKDNCGCNSGMHPGWHQLWRRPLREDLDWLRDLCVPLFEREGGQLLKDPWAARNDYIDVILDRSTDNVEAFLARHASKTLSQQEKIRALLLLGMERCSMLMYTSCGWFFDEISGIETVQVLTYASRMIQLAEDIGQGNALEGEFVDRLKKAPSNVLGNGAKVYDAYVKPSKVDILRVAAHYVLSSLFIDYPEKARHIYSYRLEDETFERSVAGRTKLATGRSRITANLTWENELVTFAAVYLGDHNVMAGVRKFEGEEPFRQMYEELRTCWERGDTPETVRVLDKQFAPPYNYSLWHLFRDERRRVLREIIKPREEETEGLFKAVYEANYPIMTYLQGLGNPIPGFMTCATEQTINTGLGRIFTEDFNMDKLQQLVSDAQKFGVPVDRGGIGLAAITWVDRQIRQVMEQKDGAEAIDHMTKVKEVLGVLFSLSLDLNLWRAQNMYFSIKKDISLPIEEKAGKGDDGAKKWVQAFNELGDYLGVKV